MAVGWIVCALLMQSRVTTEALRAIQDHQLLKTLISLANYVIILWYCSVSINEIVTRAG